MYKKFSILIGLVAAITLTGCQSIFNQKQASLLSPNVLTPTFPLLIPETSPEITSGAIINPKNADESLSRIHEKETYETVVLLSATDFSADHEYIFTYSDPGILSAQAGINMDTEAINAMTSAGITNNLGVINPQSAWNQPIIKKITHQFPNAKFIFLSINENLPSPESAAYALKSYLPPKSLVLAMADENYSENPLIKEFQKNYEQELLTQKDTNRFNNLPVKNPVITEIFGIYMNLTGGYPPENHHPSTIYLVSFGDIMLGRYVQTLMDANTVDYPFEKIDKSYMQASDLLLANLEGPITKKAIRTNTGMNFGFFPDTAPLLKKYNFDILSQANNHAYDKTAEAYAESMQLLRAQNIIPFGNAKEITPQHAAYLNIRGQKIAFLGVEDINNPIDEEKTLQTIAQSSQSGYKVIVFPHWGIEYSHTPNQRQKDLAHAWIDGGAYAIIGMHPHVIQSYETYKGRAIFYSLGNAIFDQYWSIPTQKGLSIALAINDEHLTIYFLPIKLPKSQIQLMPEQEAQKQLEELVLWGENPKEESVFMLSGKLIL